MTWDAKDLAQSAVLEEAGDKARVGNYLSVEFDDEDRIANYLFEANLPGYLGWRWSVSIAKVAGDASPTICDVVLIPGPDALLAPKWIPYADQIGRAHV